MTATTKLETMALTIVERAAVALGSEKLHGDLVALAKKSADITEIKNAAGRDQCHAAMMALANTRTSITKTGKAARDDANAFSKAVIAEEKRLIDLIEPEELRLRTLRDGWDEAREAEKRDEEAAAARAVEEKRLADERAAQEADLRAQREAQERELDAERERQAAEAARIAEERAELERQQREREEAEERAAKAAADAKAAAERAEIERQQVELREQQEALERERADVNHAEFLRAGPGVDAIVSAVAEHFDVMEADALRWLTTYTFASME